MSKELICQSLDLISQQIDLQSINNNQSQSQYQSLKRVQIIIYQINKQMNTQLLMDTFSVIIDRSQSQIQHVLRKNTSTTSKMRYVTLNLTELKYQIIQWIANAVKFVKQNYSLLLQNKLEQLKQDAFHQLSKVRLHTLLRSKLNKIKKNSFLNSTLNQKHTPSQSHTQSQISQLEQSLVMIQKDMNILQEDHQDMGISAIIQKSRFNLLQDHTLNISTISESSIVDHDLNEFLGKNSAQLKPIEIKQQLIENNLQNMISQQLTPSQNFVLENAQILDQGTNQKPISMQKVMKKKKKTIQTSTLNYGFVNKQDLLGNLLQETYNQHCLENQIQ